MPFHIAWCSNDSKEWWVHYNRFMELRSAPSKPSYDIGEELVNQAINYFGQVVILNEIQFELFLKPETRSNTKRMDYQRSVVKAAQSSYMSWKRSYKKNKGVEDNETLRSVSEMTDMTRKMLSRMLEYLYLSDEDREEHMGVYSFKYLKKRGRLLDD